MKRSDVDECSHTRRQQVAQAERSCQNDPRTCTEAATSRQRIEIDLTYLQTPALTLETSERTLQIFRVATTPVAGPFQARRKADCRSLHRISLGELMENF